MNSYNIKDIFTTDKFPQYTYIDRKISSGATYESQLKQALFADENIVYITGAYKSGKTTIYTNVVLASKLVNISGKQISSQEDFWQQISIKLSLQHILNYGQPKNIAHKMEILTRCLVDNQKILVIDDFQYISYKVQIDIIKAIREKELNGLKTIIVSVGNKTEASLAADQVSFTTINITPWKSKELEEIAYKGFSLLKVNITKNGINMLTRESIASPQLMQENCYKLAMFCREHKMREVTDETARKIIPYIKNIEFA